MIFKNFYFILFYFFAYVVSSTVINSLIVTKTLTLFVYFFYFYFYLVSFYHSFVRYTCWHIERSFTPEPLTRVQSFRMYTQVAILECVIHSFCL